MILIGVKCFLRYDDLIDMTLECFHTDLSVVLENGFVESLAFTFIGKSDKKPVTLTLWADDVIPHFCPVRSLLAYIYASKIKGGYLFPYRIQCSPKDNGVYDCDDDLWSYSSFSATVRN